MKRPVLSLLLLTLTALGGRAQQDPSFSHYWAMEPSFNPATVGKESMLNVVGAYAIQMAGFEHNPNTMYAAADMPLYAIRNHHGVGVQFMNDAIGLFSHKRFGAQYAFHRALWGGRLSAGVGVSMLSENFDGSKLELIDTSDPAFSTTEVTGTAFDLNVGLYYRHQDQWYAGVSVMHMNSPQVELGERNEYDIASTYYFTGGYNIRLRIPFLRVRTSLLAFTDGVGWRADMTARLCYNHENRLLEAGLSYSPTNSVTLLLGGTVHGIRLSYSYELYTQGIGLKNGSHELFISYQTEIDLGKKGRNLHKSVRLL